MLNSVSEEGHARKSLGTITIKVTCISIGTFGPDASHSTLTTLTTAILASDLQTESMETLSRGALDITHSVNMNMK